MGFMDKIFGSQDSKNKVQQLPTLTPEGLATLKKLFDTLNPQIGQGVQPYPGQTVAGTNELQSGVFGAAGALAPIANKALGASGTIMDYYDPGLSSRVSGQSETALTDLLKKFDPTAANKAFDVGVQAPTIAAWERDVLPKIMERFAGANAGNSGAINRTLSRSGADLMQNLGATRANTLFNAENANENRRLSALGISPAIAGMSNQNISLAGQAASLGASALGTQLGIGGAQRGIEQENLDALLAKYETAQAYNNPWLKFLPTALNTMAFENLVTPQLSERAKMMNDIGLAGQLGLGTFGIMQSLGMGGAGANAGGGFVTRASNPGAMSLGNAATMGYDDWFLR